MDEIIMPKTRQCGNTLEQWIRISKFILSKQCEIIEARNLKPRITKKLIKKELLKFNTLTEWID